MSLSNKMLHFKCWPIIRQIGVMLFSVIKKYYIELVTCGGTFQNLVRRNKLTNSNIDKPQWLYAHQLEDMTSIVRSQFETTKYNYVKT